MSNDALVPAEIPSHALVNVKSDALKAMFDDLLFGVSTGAPPRISCRAGRFRLVVGNEETPITPKELAEGEFLPVVILGAKRAFNKAYFGKAYDPNQDAESPDCFSYDGEKPDPSVAKPVCTTCAGCPMNEFGSGRNQNGQPTDGKACSDTKVLAVAYRNSVYQFRVPPSSLKTFGAYMKTLMGRSVSPGNVVTFIGLDPTAEFQKYTFKVGAFVPETAIPALAEMSQSAEVADIVAPPIGVGGGKKHQAPAPPAEKAAVEAPAEKAAVEAPAEKAKPKAKPKAKQEDTPEDEAQAAGSAGIPSDDELNALLGF